MPPLRVGKARDRLRFEYRSCGCLSRTLTRLRHAPIATPTSCASSPTMAQLRVTLRSLLLRQVGSNDWTLCDSGNAGSAFAHRAQRRSGCGNRTGEASVVRLGLRCGTWGHRASDQVEGPLRARRLDGLRRRFRQALGRALQQLPDVSGPECSGNYGRRPGASAGWGTAQHRRRSVGPRRNSRLRLLALGQCCTAGRRPHG